MNRAIRAISYVWNTSRCCNNRYRPSLGKLCSPTTLTSDKHRRPSNPDVQQHRHWAMRMHSPIYPLVLPGAMRSPMPFDTRARQAEQGRTPIEATRRPAMLALIRRPISAGAWAHSVCACRASPFGNVVALDVHLCVTAGSRAQ